MENQTQPNLQANEIKGKLNVAKANIGTYNSTLGSGNAVERMKVIKEMVFIKFGSFKKFSQALGVRESMASLLLSGKYIPLKSSTIEKIAGVIGVNAVLLSQTYSELKLGGEQNAKPTTQSN